MTSSETAHPALLDTRPASFRDLRVHGQFYDAGRREVLREVEQAKRILVCSHARPDGDAIGSMLACAGMLEQLQKQVTILSSDRVPLLYRWLPCVEAIQNAQEAEGAFDLVVMLECDSLERSRIEGLDKYRIVNIDHHASGKAFAAINWIEPEASAVAEMVFDLACTAGVHITPEIATCLYTAVMTDTGSFCYAGTDAHTLQLAAELVRLGASPAPIAQQVYFSNPLSKMQLLGVALSTLHREGRIAWLWVTQEDMQHTSAVEEDCEGIVNYAIAIAGVEVAVFLRELPDELPHQRVRLSLRSKGNVDVARIAEHFGGGGHTNASGCTLQAPLSAATQEILGVLRSL